MDFYKSKFFYITLALVLISFAAGYSSKNTRVQAPKQETVKFNTTSPAALFYSQSAQIQGKITNINGNMATIQSNNGASADFKIADIIYITKYVTEKGKQKPVYSSDKKDLEINKGAIINLSLPTHLATRTDAYSQFELSTITFLP